MSHDTVQWGDSGHTSYVAKFPVLENQKHFSSRQLVQTSNRSLREVIDNVRMGLEDAYIVSNLLC